MKRKFFTNIIILLSLNLSVKAFWVLGIDRSVQNVVGAGEYGFYFSLLSFSLLFSILLDFGLTNYNNLKISREPGTIASFLGNMMIIRILFAVIYSVASIVIALSLGYAGRQLNLLWILLFNQFLASFILFLRSNISGLQLFITDSILSVTDRLIMIIICGIMLWSGLFQSAFRIEWFVYAQTLSYLVTFIIAFSLVILKGQVSNIGIDKQIFFTILKESFPFALLALFMSVSWRVDSVMLERMLPDGQVKAGIYAQSFRFFDAAAMIPYLFAVILLPMYSRMMKNKQDISPVLTMSAKLLITPLLIIAIPLIFSSFNIMDLLYTSYITESSQVFSILMAGIFPVSIVYVFSTVLTANGNLKILNIITAGGMILNIIINFFLIPASGPEGAAISRVITQTLVAASFLFIVYKTLNIRLDKQFIFRSLTLLILLIFIGFLNKKSGFTWSTGLTIQMVAGVIIALITRLIDIKAFIGLFKNE